MNGIVGKRDADGYGLAFVSAEGLHEVAALDDEEATLAVTLFRSFDRVYLQTAGQRAQLQQQLTFRYAIVPLTSEMQYADLLDIQHTLADTDMVYSRRLAAEEEPGVNHSYLSVDNDSIRISVLKCAQDGNGIILRLFSTSPDIQEANLRLNWPFTQCVLTNLNEEFVGVGQREDDTIRLKFAPWQIQTLRIN